MIKMVKKTRINLILGLCIAMSLVAVSSAMASTITFTNLDGVAQYAGEYVGAIAATLDDVAISGGVYCVDIAKTTYVPSSFAVTVGTLQPFDMTSARHISDAPGVLIYEEAAWLRGQIPTHSAEIGVIQFAVWGLFDPDHVDSWVPSHGGDLGAVNSWIDLAGKIDPNKYDFSSVRIYTPGDNNQEFMSGVAIAKGLPPTGNNTVPIPASFVLLGSGLLGLGLLRFRKKAVPVRQGRDCDRA